MFLSKNKTFLLFSIILSSLLVSTAIFAVDKRELTSAQKTNFLPRDISSENEVNEFFKPSRWGNDVTIATGTVSGGISATYDISGNMYAARCSTYNDTAKHAVKIYKSTDDGNTWHLFKSFVSAGGYNFSYPQLLICQKADSNFLYLFYLRSDLNGTVRLGRWKLDGTGSPSWYDVVSGDSDTITYYSVCSNLDGDTIIVVYQTNSPGDSHPNLAAAVSADYGKHWSVSAGLISGVGAHPDLAYGDEGYVYLAYLRTDLDDIGFQRSTNNGYNWSGYERLTNDGDSHHDDFPKIAALHTLPADTTTVWVAYNHTRVERDTIKYDDDTPIYAWYIPNTYGDDLFNVRFTPPSGYSLKSAQFLFARKTGTGGVRVYVWSDFSGFPAEKIDSVDVSHADIQLYPNWTTVDFSSKNITLSKVTDLHIGYTSLGPPATDTVSIFSDDGVPAGSEHRSILFSEGAWKTVYNISGGYDYNFMIRAVVEQGVGNTDLRFAYSTNSGVDWVKDQIIAGEASYDEMACNLHVYRSPTWDYLDLCYLNWPTMRGAPKPDIYYTWSHSSSPHLFQTPHQAIVDDLPHWSLDCREACQIVFPPLSEYPGIVYAGTLPLKENKGSFVDAAWNLYFDYHDWTDVEEDFAEEQLPAQFSLRANYPNPFNPATRIQYTVGSNQAHPIHTSLRIYNVLGQLVRTIVNEPKEPGTYEVIWEGKDDNGNEVASGVYFYKLEAENFAQTKKMVLIR